MGLFDEVINMLEIQRISYILDLIFYILGF